MGVKIKMDHILYIALFLDVAPLSAHKYFSMDGIKNPENVTIT